MYPLLFIHIVSGVAAVPSGVLGLYSAKGSRVHRLSGNSFFVSMLIMSGAGALMATFVKPLSINVIAGTLTFYLVATGWLTVVRRGGQIGKGEYVLLAMVSLITAFCFLLTWRATHSATGLADGTSAGGYLFFGGIALLAVAGDARLLLRGGIAGMPRIARHLWRMWFALSIATLSLFLGTPNRVLLPEFLRHSSLRFAPVIVIIATGLWWMVRAHYRHGVTVLSGARLRDDAGTGGLRVPHASLPQADPSPGATS